MQKIVNMLEQHVQWLVLGLGAAWLLFVVWAYVINPPVTVDLAGNSVVPAKVDEIVKEKADQLNLAMKGNRRVVVPTPVDPVESFMAAINATPPVRDLPAMAFLPPIGRLDTADTGIASSGAQRPGPQNQGPKMAKLPDAPALTDVRTRIGRTTVLVPDPAGQVDQANPALGPTTPTDLDWVTVRFTLPKDDLVTAYNAAQVPPLFFKALILQTELVREELLPDGTWGNQVVVPSLKVGQLQPMPTPGNDASDMQYLEWVRMNQLDVVQPVFYTTTKGDRWGVPGMEDKEGTIDSTVFDPAHFVDPRSDLSKLTPEQRAEVFALRRKMAAEAAQQRRQPGGNPRQRGPVGGEGGEFGPGAPRGGGGGGGRGPGAGGPNNFQDRGGMPGGRIPGGFPGGFPGGGEFGPAEGFAPPGAQQQGQVNLAGEFPIPNGEFDPRDAQIKDIIGWLHDATVQPGRTYRYKVRYKLKNPVWKTMNVTEEPEMAREFAIDFPGTEWTSPVTIPSLTSFFLSAGFNAGTTRAVRFDVFKFQDGQLHKQAFTIAPGDSIGKTEKSIEFATGWSLVDIRKDMSTNADYALITDSTGREERRVFSTDQQSPEFRKLSQQLADQTTAAAAGG